MFNQEVFVCDWWYNVNCESSQDLYRLNDNLYQVSYCFPTLLLVTITYFLSSHVFTLTLKLKPDWKPSFPQGLGNPIYFHLKNSLFFLPFIFQSEKVPILYTFHL